MRLDLHKIERESKFKRGGTAPSLGAWQHLVTTMPTSSQSVNRPQRRLIFIDNNGTSSTKHNSTRVRRHAMEEHMRDRRWQTRTNADTDVHEQGARLQTAPEQSGIQESHPDSSNTIKIITFDSQTPVVTENGHEQGEILEPITSTPLMTLDLMPTEDPEESNDGSKHELAITTESSVALAKLYHYELLSPSHTTTSCSSSSTPVSNRGNIFLPMSRLSVARIDPFDVLSMSLSVDDEKLFKFYAIKMPEYSYGSERRSPKALDWYQSVFIPEAMKGAVTFQNTILVHAANTKAWVHEETETRKTLEHRYRAISALKEFYKLYPNDTSDAVITATMSAAALEDFDPRKDRRRFAWMHWTAAMHKIRKRGGPASLEYISSLRKLVNWQDYILSGYDGRGSSFFFTPEAIIVGSDQYKEAYGRQEIRNQCEHFLTFLRRVERLASNAASQDKDSYSQ